jgi:hypothetical protein
LREEELLYWPDEQEGRSQEQVLKAAIVVMALGRIQAYHRFLLPERDLELSTKPPHCENCRVRSSIRRGLLLNEMKILEKSKQLSLMQMVLRFLSCPSFQPLEQSLTDWLRKSIRHDGLIPRMPKFAQHLKRHHHLKLQL